MKPSLTASLGAPLAGDTLLALAAYALATTLAPGPNTLLLLSSGLNYGLRRTGWHLLGILWGTYLAICLAGVGLGALFLAAPGMQTVLRVAAGFYMLWLAYRFWQAAAPQAVQAPRPLRFGEAVLFQLGNPKVWLMAAAAIAGFVPAGAHYLERMLAAALVFCLAAAPGIVLWAAGGTALQARMRTPSHLRRLRRGMALITAAAAGLFWM
ncbi:MAG: LysE family translocator [Pseudomonadota bacterium]